MTTLIPQRALISVSNKTGLLPFAQALTERGVELYSTGGTAEALKAAHIPVIEVSDVTHFPEMMGGRLKTLHPTIHGGILGRRGTDDVVMREHHIAPIDLVVVNLYPFQATVAKGADLATCIENIDIGGPAMLRSAAKNHHDVTVIVDPYDYTTLMGQIMAGGITQEQRFAYAAKAFAHTAQYDSAISNYFQEQITPAEALPAILSLQLNQVQGLRYGENPHQRAGLYTINQQRAGFTDMIMHQGKPLSFNNLNDAQAALSCLRDFGSDPTCVIIKHANPCGIAQSDTLIHAYEKAYACDPSSAFGGIIAVNQTVDESLAKRIVEQQFMEVMIAPQFDSKALAVFQTKPNIRVLSYPMTAQDSSLILKCIDGGVLVQDPDMARITETALSCVTTRQPTPAELQDLIFAWRVVKHVKSNAIVYAKNGQTLGIGAGQSSRVASSQIAVWKAAAAHLSLTEAAMASDAFFPFRDSIDAAQDAGITAIIQPGGSMRDDEVIAAANHHGMTMVFTGIRHFNH